MTTVSPEIQNKVVTQISSVMDKAKVLFGYNESFPEIHYKIKGRVAGKAWITQNKLGFNAQLLNDNVDEFINQTVTHEVAHLIAYKVYHDTGHGSFWKHVMMSLGATPKRCHNYDVTNTSTRPRFAYVCNCNETHQLSNIIHNKISNGAVYRCRQCRAPIRLKQDSVVPVTPSANTSLSPTLSQVKVIMDNNQVSKSVLIQLVMTSMGVSENTAKQYIYKVNKATA